jgi:hypothetical protein
MKLTVVRIELELSTMLCAKKTDTVIHYMNTNKINSELRSDLCRYVKEKNQPEQAPCNSESLCTYDCAVTTN